MLLVTTLHEQRPLSESLFFRDVCSVQKRTSRFRETWSGSRQVAEQRLNPQPRGFSFYCLPAILILSFPSTGDIIALLFIFWVTVSCLEILRETALQGEVIGSFFLRSNGYICWICKERRRPFQISEINCSMTSFSGKHYMCLLEIGLLNVSLLCVRSSSPVDEYKQVSLWWT